MSIGQGLFISKIIIISLCVLGVKLSTRLGSFSKIPSKGPNSNIVVAEISSSEVIVLVLIHL